RVAREMHDSVSQMLVGVRYALDTTRRRLAKGDTRGPDTLDRGIDHLSGAIQEVRRISRDLRPAILDDLGLGPALKTLVEDFSERTGIETKFQSVVFRNRLDDESKIALYRVAQEALTNVERHAQATEVSLALRGSTRGAVMRIQDNGIGIKKGGNRGLGLRNMQERIDFLDGTLTIQSTKAGTMIEAIAPLTHMLKADDRAPSKEVVK
ncbi:MAG: histidine kinase, partial [Pseudomonadota bacterium]